MTAAQRQASHREKLTVGSDLTGLTAVEYGRKSTFDARNPGKSVEDQLGVLDAECARRGLRVLARLDDPSQGASKYSRAKVRQAFEQIIHLISTESVAVLAMWELSRATRRLAIFGDLMELCEDRNVLILLRDRLYDPRDHRDRMTLGIRAVMDENEVALGRERTLRGTASAAVMGLPHGPHLYGYRRVYDDRTGALLRVDIDPEAAAVIRELAVRVLAGESSMAIARDLNARDVPRPRGGRWAAAEVRQILTKPAYIGKRLHTVHETGETALYDAVWAPILDQQQFDELATLFRARSRGSHSTNPKYLLTGIVLCGRCDDRPMYVQAARHARQTDKSPQIGYVCPGCKRTRRQGALERYVGETMAKWLADPAFREAEAAEERTDDDRHLRQQLDDARAELEAAEEDLAAGEISARAFTLTERRLTPLIEELQAAADTTAPSHTAMARYLADGAKPYDDMTLAERREIIGAFIRVRCHAAKPGRGAFDPDTVDIFRV